MVGALHREGRSCTEVRLGCRNVQSPVRQTQSRFWGRGSTQGIMCRPGCRLGPTSRHPSPQDPRPPSSFGPRSFRDIPTPHPQVFSVACSAPAPGDRSAGGDAQPGLPAFASAPSPARVAQDAASEQRPRGSGPRPDRAPGQPERRRRAWPFRSDPPLCPGFWGNQTKASSASLPAAPRTPSSPTLAPNTPSGARLTL